MSDIPKETRMDFLDSIRQNINQTDAILHQTSSPTERAFHLAEGLPTLWSSSPLFVCLLRQEGASDLGVVDGEGKRHPELAEVLAGSLAGLPDRSPSPETQRIVPLPPAVGLPGHSLVIQEIAYQDTWLGALAVAVEDKMPPDTLADGQKVLATYAPYLALRLSLESKERAYRSLQEDAASLAWLADLGDLTGSLAHEFNNFLNVLLLQLTLLEMEIPARFHADLAELRRLGQRHHPNQGVARVSSETPTAAPARRSEPSDSRSGGLPANGAVPVQ